MLQRAASNAYSWWWASHIRTKQSKWLEQNLQDMEEKVGAALKILHEEGDSFVRRAEMYYRQRPELIQFVEESFRGYRSLAERYDHISTELQKANNTIASCFPDQVPFMDDEDDDGSPRLPRKMPEGSKPNASKVPKPPQSGLKDLKTVIKTATKKFSAKKIATPAATPKVKSGLSKQEARQEVDKLQKQILALQTVKEFLKSSYDNSLAKYWETEEQIKELQDKVSSLEDEIGEGVVIEDDEARRLMTEAALKSCQEALAQLQVKQKKSVDQTKIESKRVKEAKAKLESLMDEFNYDQSNQKREPRAKRDVKEVEDLDEDVDRTSHETQKLKLLQEKIKENFDSSTSLSVAEMAEKIDELVNKVVSLETEVSSQTALVKRLRAETNELQSNIRTLESDKVNLINDKTNMNNKLRKMEDKLHRVQDLNHTVEDQNANLLTHFTEASFNLDHLSEKVLDVKPEEKLEMKDLSQTERRSTGEAESEYGFEEQDALNKEHGIKLLNDEHKSTGLLEDEVNSNKGFQVTFVEGALKSNKELHATGLVKGDVKSDKVLPVTGFVEGDVRSDKVLPINDSVEGDVKSDKVLPVTGYVEGDVKSAKALPVTSSMEGDAKSDKALPVAGSVEGDARPDKAFSVAGSVEGDVRSDTVLPIKDSVEGDVKSDKALPVTSSMEGDAKSNKVLPVAGSVEGDARPDKVLSVAGSIESDVRSNKVLPITDFAEVNVKSNEEVQVTGSLNSGVKLDNERKIITSLEKEEAPPVKRKSPKELKEQEKILNPGNSHEQAKEAVSNTTGNQNVSQPQATSEADNFSESSGNQKENSAMHLSPEMENTLKVDSQQHVTAREDEPDWRQLFMNGMQEREKALLTEYTNTLRSYKDLNKQLSEVEKKNQENLFDISLKLKELKAENAMKNEEIKLLLHKLGLLQKSLEENANLKQVTISEAPTEKKDDIEEPEKEDNIMAMLKVHQPATISATEERFRANIDAILEENLIFWLKFSITFTEIQKFETTITDLQSEVSKLVKKVKSSEGSSSIKYTAKSDARPLFKHLMEIQTEISVWWQKSVLLKDEQQHRFSSLCDIQEEITKALKASAEDDDFQFTSYQAAKFQGEVLNMKHENNKVADEIQAGLVHVTNLQIEVEKALSKLNEHFGLTNSKRQQQQIVPVRHPGKQSNVPLRSFIFGVKPKKQKQSIFSVVTPGMHKKYRALKL
ncbi:hypothetical protein L6164_027331 [Bauhinia variegata]|uniref:Uncharacterized protein n=1 Tax=Bauhinia variegata TaxID=167791 RepID=A0ACB9LUA3_BAUVA|nr:hypothetical protein L6164_027331 [Bauhinia variegata]